MNIEIGKRSTLSKSQIWKCLLAIRGLKDAHAQHRTTVSTCTIPFTIQKTQHAKSSQSSHRQHYHDYKSIAWNLGSSPRNSCCCRKTGNKFLHKSFTLSPYIWTLQTGPDTKSSLFRKAIHPFTLAYLRDMVHDKKDLFVFLRPLEESCHYVLWSAQAACRVLLAKKLLHFPSQSWHQAQMKGITNQNWHWASKNHTRPHQLWQIFTSCLSPFHHFPPALAESFSPRARNPE